jgi:hypothetical protein
MFGPPQLEAMETCADDGVDPAMEAEPEEAAGPAEACPASGEGGVEREAGTGLSAPDPVVGGVLVSLMGRGP